MPSSFAEAYRDLRQSVVRLVFSNPSDLTQGSQGTGWILGCVEFDDWRQVAIVTAAHVIADAGTWIPAEFQMFNSDSDLVCDNKSCHIDYHMEEAADIAILLVKMKTDSANRIGKGITILASPDDGPSNEVQHPGVAVGEPLGWIGYPPVFSLGHFDSPGMPILCVGHVAAAGMKNGFHTYLVDGNVHPGMSGGPVFSSGGVVIGCVSAIVGEPQFLPDGTLNPTSGMLRSFGVVSCSAMIVAIMGEVRRLEHGGPSV